MSLKYSICLNVYGGVEGAKAFFASLGAHPPDGDYEILVAANLAPETAQVAPESRSLVIDLPRRVPASIAMNLIISMADGEYIALCDDDIVFLHDDWAKRMGAALDGGAVMAVPRILGRVRRQSKQGAKEDHCPEEYIGQTRFVKECIGCCRMIPHSLLDFNSPTFVGYPACFGYTQFDDREWAERLRNAGHLIAVCDDVLIRHGRTERRHDYEIAKRNYRRIGERNQ